VAVTLDEAAQKSPFSWAALTDFARLDPNKSLSCLYVRAIVQACLGRLRVASYRA
jgi:hypothetical protein